MTTRNRDYKDHVVFESGFNELLFEISLLNDASRSIVRFLLLHLNGTEWKTVDITDLSTATKSAADTTEERVASKLRVVNMIEWGRYSWYILQWCDKPRSFIQSNLWGIGARQMMADQELAKSADYGTDWIAADLLLSQSMVRLLENPDTRRKLMYALRSDKQPVTDEEKEAL